MLIENKKRIQKSLKQMSRYVNGYCWTRVLAGYRCEGGMHFVIDAEGQARMTESWLGSMLRLCCPLSRDTLDKKWHLVWFIAKKPNLIAKYDKVSSLGLW
jgi:hypothetical protein